MLRYEARELGCGIRAKIDEVGEVAVVGPVAGVVYVVHLQPEPCTVSVRVRSTAP